jgi:hypothetical protein
VNTTTTTQSQLSKLAAFRQSIYGCLTKARDALFELIAAILTTAQLTSFPELSCAPVFCRQWPSLYEAAQDGAINCQELLELEVESLPPGSRPLLVGDHTAWSRAQWRRTRVGSQSRKSVWQLAQRSALTSMMRSGFSASGRVAAT